MIRRTPALACPLLAAAAMTADPLEAALTDPIPTKIAKGAISIELTPVLTGLVAPADFVNSGDGSGKMYVVEQTGQILSFTPGHPAQTVLNIASRLAADPQLRRTRASRARIGPELRRQPHDIHLHVRADQLRHTQLQASAEYGHRHGEQSLRARRLNREPRNRPR
jgi:hypothetical protein